MARRIVFEEIPRRSIEYAAQGPDPGGIYGQILERILEREAAGETVYAWKIGTQVAVGPDPVELYIQQARQHEPKPAPPRSTDLVPGQDIPLPRPENCRNVLQAAGKPHPKSGCQVCGNGGLFGCPYERRGR